MTAKEIRLLIAVTLAGLHLNLVPTFIAIFALFYSAINSRISFAATIASIAKKTLF
jgi:hypothetical protein